MTYNVEITSINVELEQNVTEVEILVSFETGVGDGGIEEAPIDGKQYARKDADWEEVAASGDVNVIESISMNGVAFNVDVNKDVDITHDHSGESINPDNIVLDKTYTNAEAESLAVGAIFYNIDQLNWMLKLSDVNYYNFGEELPVLSRIGDNQNHLEGQAGYISGGATQLNNISLASSVTGVVNCLATQDVLNTGDKRGYYCYFGQVRSFPYSNVKKSTDNENTWVDGAKLYLCNESGKYSTTKEAAPAKASLIGFITNRSGANITVMFQPQIALGISDLSDVDGADTTVASGSSFLFKLTSGLWKTITESNFITWIKGLTDEVFIGSTTPTGTEDIWIDPNSADVTTADIPDSTDKRYQTDYQVANKFGAGANYAQFDSNGNLKLYGNATQWEDLNFAPNSSGGAAATLPDYVTINNVTHREFTSANNQLCGDIKELPHSYKASSTLTPHLHLFLKSSESAGTTGVTFTLYWELRQTTGTTSGSLTLSATSAQLAANANKIDIPGTTFAGASELGAQLSLRLARTAGDAGDVIVTTYGVHYELDSIGSNEITTK